MSKKKQQRKLRVLNLRLDEQEMVYQRIVVKRPNDQIISDFFLCRFYGSRDQWIDVKVLAPHFQKLVLATP